MNFRSAFIASLLCGAVLFQLPTHAFSQPAAKPVALDAICGALSEDATPTKLPLEFQPGDHVVFIGNTLFERMQEDGAFEAMLLQRFPKDKLVLRTLAWPADELTIQPRPDNFGDIHEHLTREKADVIIAAYGFNESFQGLAAIPKFEVDLARFIGDLRRHRYNGQSQPRIVLVSPIAHENLGAPLPDGSENNVRLKAYTAAMAKVASLCRVGFVDAFTPSLAAMTASTKLEPLTYNGIHLTAHGYRFFSEELFRGMFDETAPQPEPAIQAEVVDRNEQFLLRYRALNTFYIYGDRAKPYGVVNFPGELDKLDEMIANRDQRLWDMAEGKPVPAKIDDSNTTELPKITGDRPINEWMTPEDELKAFKIDPRFNVNVFASEEMFPDLAKPIQMRWDTKGRLWVSCSTTYPQLMPGEKANDKIIILEDTNQDGKADKCSVFATGLHIPLAFEFGDGGVYVSEEPHMTFLKDTDGDGKADVHRIVLTGFGTEDSHHALHDFAWTPDGDLIFRESIFLHSQIETPYGPVRARESSFYRFRPATQKLIAFGSYVSTNPWGLTFDEWGQQLGSHPVFATAVQALNAPYPDVHVPAGAYFPAYSGTCGQDFIYSKNFPKELQGCFVRVRYKPVNTVELHRWVEKDSHFEEEKIGHIIQSSNLSFIPTDTRFGPRGDLYICDWYNPVKGHMQYSLRDTRRDKTSGRIWRVTGKDLPLPKAPKIAGQSIPRLLNLLKSYEYRIRYTARMELRERDHAEVKKALDKWVKKLNPKDPRFLHHEMEAIWMYRGIRATNTPLLISLLNAPDHHARAAATRQLRWWHDEIPNSISLLRERANDTNGLVRLEAALAASYIGTQDALVAAMDLLKHPMDNYLNYALRTSVDSYTLKPYWRADTGFTDKHPELLEFIKASQPKKKVFGGSRGNNKDPFDLLNPQVITISTVPERMQFTVTEFKVRAGAPVKVVLENPDVTPHNILICAPGTADEIGLAANEMAKLPDAFEKSDFIPKSDKILHFTKMLKQGETGILRFHAPKEPGTYPYICSFPGHYLVMRGVMIVE